MSSLDFRDSEDRAWLDEFIGSTEIPSVQVTGQDFYFFLGTTVKG